MSKSKYKSKYFVSLVFCIIALFIFSGIAVFVVKGMFFDKNVPVDPNSVVLNSEDNVVIINNRLPVSDDFGRTIKDDNAGSFIYLEFGVKNTSSVTQNFQIYLTKQSPVGKEIKNGFIKFHLTDGNNEAFPIYSKNSAPSYIDLYYIKDKADSKNIYEGKISANEEKNFRLRVWVADNYVVPSEDEAFSFEVGVRAI